MTSEEKGFLFKDIKEYNKYLLTLVCCLILVLTGVISYAVTNSYAKWNSGYTSSNTLKIIATKKKLADEIMNKKDLNGLEVVTHDIDSTLRVDSRFATEYRYRGGNTSVNNYVMFNNEIWRIIGIMPVEDVKGNVENKIKIIRENTFDDSFNWSNNGSNNWAISTLNDYLNTTYYNSLSTDAKSMISTAKYYLGGYNGYPQITSDVMWRYEREAGGSMFFYGSNAPTLVSENRKIALMYVSDYGYAASKECTTTLYGYASDKMCNTSGNWLFSGKSEWLLAHCAANSYSAYPLLSNGNVDTGYNIGYYKLYVRPVLYLVSDIKISGGIGSNDDPYILSI